LPVGGEEDFTTELLPNVDEAVDRLLLRVEKVETEYYRERLEAEKAPARSGWWQKMKRLTGG
jgi:hypothetical protein